MVLDLSSLLVCYDYNLGKDTDTDVGWSRLTTCLDKHDVEYGWRMFMDPAL